MTIVESLPQNIRRWPEWLELLVVSPQLVELVEELTPIRRSRRMSLVGICGSKLAEVFKRGLKALDDAQLGQLLDHPHTLYELQEQAFASCSPYWDALAQKVGAQASNCQTANSRSTHSRTSQLAKRAVMSRREVGAALVLAAAVMIAIGIWNPPPGPQGKGWGLAQVESLSPDLKDSTYLKKLADLSAQWNNKKPDTTAGLLVRLRDYRAGCQRLIDHPKPQLGTEDREWLNVKCQKWAGDIDRLIEKLESGEIAFGDAAREASGIATRMENVLRDKAVQLS